ncbi:hypothetical protein HN014_04375 [Aquimarina sp. TRL1]|uniref:hypothetical protein n=1 Tax=Aquimarina sp. (strain TRL1) TaxID=2736252 RepID=UPI00158BBC37|nr:hypothetical protein [Aquimarina sp. TRL1]QKX04174.1 hypothetical protein HN014_04375 [Aquimarina sp. TRL1]
MKKKPQAIKQHIINEIMGRAIMINKQCKEHCRDFRIMVSGTQPDTLILRWIEIDISNVDRPLQCYRYQCFDMDGTPQNCSIHYSDQEEANEFFMSLTTLYKQEFSIDHTL